MKRAVSAKQRKNDIISTKVFLKSGKTTIVRFSL